MLGRDDLTVEFVTLLDLDGRYRDAADLLSRRRFHPWEGGEGLVSGQWVVAHRELSRDALRAGDPELAAELARTAMAYPPNLGEGKHLLTAENEVQLLLGQCLAAAGAETEAGAWFNRASRSQGDPAEPDGAGLYWQALALRELGDEEAARARLTDLAEQARTQLSAEVRIPYFATSLPTLLLFDDDLSERAHDEALYLQGLALLGQGKKPAADRRFRQLLEKRPEHLDARLRLAGR